MMLGASERVGPRPPPTSSIIALDKQLQGGDVEVNAAMMSRDDLITWSKKLRETAHRVKSLRILCVPRGTMWSEYHYGQLQEHVGGRLIYSSQEHKLGVKVASANAQHHLARSLFCKALTAVLRHGRVEELVLGLRLSKSGYTALSDALAANTTLKRLSFAGSHMGDERVIWLKPGLMANNSLEELDLTACGLTDEAARAVAAVLKTHVDRRLALAFDEQLRQYPNTSLPRHRAHLEYHAQLRTIARNVDQVCGGLLHLELAENKLTDEALRALCAALSYDRRLIFLSLRANKLTAAVEGEVISLMKEHQALLRVDLRQNADPKLGILKLKRRVAPHVFSAAIGFQPNPAAPSLLSPARTDTSMPIWALREEMPDSMGPTPLATPRPQAPNSPGHVSTVSWGDLHLLARGAPSTTAGAGHGGNGGRNRDRSVVGGGGGGGGGDVGTNKAPWLLRTGSFGRRMREGGENSGGSGGGGGGGGASAGMKMTPATPQVRQGQLELAAAPRPLSQPVQQGGQVWGDREVTLSGEQAPEQSGTRTAPDYPDRRAVAGAADSDFVLQGSGPEGASAAAATAASMMTSMPAPVSAREGSFGFQMVNGSGAQPRAAAAVVVAPSSSGFGVGPDLMGQGSPPPPQGHAAPTLPAGVSTTLPSGRSPLSRVTLPAPAAAGGGGGGTASAAPWVWGRPVNPDGSDMVVLSAVMSPSRPQPGGDMVSEPYQQRQLRSHSAAPPRQPLHAPGGAATGGASTSAAVPYALGHHMSAGSEFQQLHPQPGTGWVNLAGTDGDVTWLGMPVPVTGPTAPKPLQAFRQLSASQQGSQPQAALPIRPASGSALQRNGGAASSAAAHRSGMADTLVGGEYGTGMQYAYGQGTSPTAGGYGSGAAAAAATTTTVADNQRQAAFMSMLHREALATGQQGSYDHLFTKQRQQRWAKERRASPGRQGGGGGSSRRLLRRSSPRRSAGSGGKVLVRAGLKRRKHPGTATTTPATTRTRSRSPTQRNKSLSRSRASSTPHMTPTRHYVQRRGAGGDDSRGGSGAYPFKSRSTGGRTPARRGTGGGIAGGGASTRKKALRWSAMTSRKGRHVRAKRTRGSGAFPNYPASSADPETLLALERSLLQMAAEVGALETAAAASRAAVAAAAEHDAAERAEAVHAGRAAAEAAARAAAAAEAAQRAATEAVDRAMAAERRARVAVRRAKDVARRSMSPPRREAAEAVGVSEPAREIDGAAPPPRPLIVQLRPRSDVQSYDGTARGQGVNVNTIIQQLDRWCGLCDTALLQPPSEQQRHPQQRHQPQKPQPPQQQQQQHQQQQPHSSLRTILQGKLHPQVPHAHAHPQAHATATTSSAQPQPDARAPAAHNATAAMASASAAAATHVPTIVPKLQLQKQHAPSAEMKVPCTARTGSPGRR